MVASLTMSGLGVSMLPPQIYQREIARGELMVLDTEPILQPIEFISVFRRDREPGFIKSIAEIALETNTFRDARQDG